MKQDEQLWPQLFPASCVGSGIRLSCDQKFLVFRMTFCQTEPRPLCCLRTGPLMQGITYSQPSRRLAKPPSLEQFSFVQIPLCSPRRFSIEQRLFELSNAKSRTTQTESTPTKACESACRHEGLSEETFLHHPNSQDAHIPKPQHTAKVTASAQTSQKFCFFFFFFLKKDYCQPPIPSLLPLASIATLSKSPSAAASEIHASDKNQNTSSTTPNRHGTFAELSHR